MSKKKQDDATPRTPPGEPARLVEFPLDRFLLERALWACNYFVLWPLGLALTATVERDDETGELVHTQKIDVREWTYPVGAPVETIDQRQSENEVDYNTFLAFVAERVGSMRKKERKLAMQRLIAHSIATSDGVLLNAR